MFAQVHRPQALSPEELDRYLAQGWFRMGQTIFTTSFLNFKGRFYDAVWLRIHLDKFDGDTTQERLIKKNEAFRVIAQPMVFTVEKEELFMRYRESVSFEASPSLSHLLYGKSNENIFQTYELEVYDNNQLIAVGVFDLGKESAAGITSFYDPAYKRFSLGKYLIYLKINYCKVKGLKYFYPGYFVPGYSPFDYKLKIGKSALHYYDLHALKWIQLKSFSYVHTPLQQMHARLNQLQVMLSSANIQSRIFHYDFFDANLIPDLMGMEFFDFPVFLFALDLTPEPVQPLVVYDVRDALYRLYKCVIVWSPDEETDRVHDQNYSHLLKIQRELCASANPNKIITALLMMKRPIGENMTNI
ncbi:MAG TPA: arginyl-tRNA--protein arginylyltransferase [Cyclobacteriaceae bacterium]|nr:arginyl-tRNA--protein arginylyltransferase [Cyclobacteriaceae bacterium]